MIEKGMKTRVYYVHIGGFDTHSGQVNKHQKLWGQVSDAVSTFIADLKKTGNLDRTTVLGFSEFGRRVKENASGGTDHGQGAPLFVWGNKIKGGLHGKSPSLDPDDVKASKGDLKFTTDFRSVYADILKNWMKADHEKILGKEFKPLGIFK
jgi:uncharacterized protein (DUF1501 family)